MYFFRVRCIFVVSCCAFFVSLVRMNIGLGQGTLPCRRAAFAARPAPMRTCVFGLPVRLLVEGMASSVVSSRGHAGCAEEKVVEPVARRHDPCIFCRNFLTSCVSDDVGANP
ncbi:unnamed protein product [Ectocarpus sp. 12 AP-2014]